MESNKQYIESFLTIYLFKNVTFLVLDFNLDNLKYLLKEEIDYINKISFDNFIINFDKNNKINVQFNSRHINKDILSFILLLKSGHKKNILLYIDLNFSEEYKRIILPFFQFLEGDRYELVREIDFLLYFRQFKVSKLKKILIFLYYGIANDSKINTIKSIEILTEVIEEYPYFASFYLLRMRQTFNLVYKILIGVNKFNNLIVSKKGKLFLYNYKLIKDCFHDLDKANSLLPNYVYYYFFKGKFLLHLLDENGLKHLSRCLELGSTELNNNITSWYGTYYLQIGELNKAKYFLEKVKYSSSDRYKEYSKLIFLYLKLEKREIFFNFINDKKKKIEVLLYNSGKYYKYCNGKLIKWLYIDDSYDHRTKMGYKLLNFDTILNSYFSDKKKYLNKIFDNISREYSEHWYAEGGKKVVFYSYDCFTFGESTILQKHDNK